MYNPFSLKGKKILIIGASSGIGKSTAIECSKLNASLVINGRNEQRLNDTLIQLDGSNNRAVRADITSSEELDFLINSVDSLDGVVLCAGKGMMLPIQFSTREKILNVFDSNFLYPVELLNLLIKKKKLNRGASIVAVSSMGGTYFYTIGNGIYGASKAALDSFMKFCARELAPKGIRVNTVLPAMVDTPLIHQSAVSEADHAADAQTYPLKRYGKPEDIAYGIIYLLSDAAIWVTGTSLIIDGGKHLV